MLRRPAAITAATALLTVGAVACAADEPASDPAGTSVAADAVHVVAAFYPLQYVAEQVGGGRAAVTGLAPPGVEAHDLELSPQQMATVADADLVLYLADFQPAVDDAIAAHAGAAVDVATLVPLLDPGGRPEDDHDDDHGDEDDGHGHSSADPHLWLDPTRLATIADEIGTRLSDIDPDHATDYAGNAAALRGELEALDAEYADGLADCERREIVVSHAAFGYLTDRYDLAQIAISGLSPEDEPTPQRLAEVIREAGHHGATTIYFEVLVSDRVARVIADEVGARTAVLDPIEGLAAGSEEDYLSLMRTNLAALREGLGCL